MQDPKLEQIMESFRQFCRGEQTAARAEMAQLWKDLEDAPAYHRCVLAHFIADTQQAGAGELEWDLRALEIAQAALEAGDDPTAEAVEKFLPSLHMNAADSLRKQSDFSRAAEHVEQGLRLSGNLGLGPYGQKVRAELIRIEAQVNDLDSGPAMIFED